MALRPRKPEGSLGRTAQDGHLDSHTAPELCFLVVVFLRGAPWKLKAGHVRSVPFSDACPIFFAKTGRTCRKSSAGCVAGRGLCLTRKRSVRTEAIKNRTGALCALKVRSLCRLLVGTEPRQVNWYDGPGAKSDTSPATGGGTRCL